MGSARNAAVLLISLWSRAASQEPEPSPVPELSGSTFDEMVRDGTDQPWFVKFYAPWCGHCKRLVPLWEQLAAKLQGQVALAKVDATAEEGLAYKYDVAGYPTLVLIVDGERYNFRGARTLEALEAFALGGYKEAPQERYESSEVFGGPNVLGLGGDLDEAVRSSELPLLVVFYIRGCGHCRSMESAWGELAVELKDQVRVASLDAMANRPLAEHWDVGRFPTIKLVKGGRVYDFDGDRTVEDLKTFALGDFGSDSSPLPSRLKDVKGEKTPGDPQDAGYEHLVVGFLLGMACAGSFWALWYCFSSSSREPADKEVKAD
ncbi:unnamed protein product [Effrenium voratum]|uniref:Thioredoxin domain-containing protein n=1 Tax=Effrenium voratum TaxID=2562239 RepID=A0AA36I770_9DINO|nr:unnamed protein product [Effrenium voratum]CAJ1424102.1 unnamed protein product [Effrenium voratum]